MGVRGNLTLWTAGTVYAASAAVCCAVAATGAAHVVDLHVYRMGGDAVLHGQDLYQLRYSRLPFTYPPFAAVVFTGLAVLPWVVAATSLTAASAVTLPVALYLALRLPRSSPGAIAGSIAGSAAAWRVALVAGAAGIWLEPVRTTLGYGQVDVLLTAAVLYDLALPDSARRKGVATGLAAGLKLLPVIFVVYLLITRRYRAGVTAAVAFAGSVAVGFAVLPGSSAWYWSGTFARPGHVSPVEDVENQSLLGVLARTAHTDNVLALWLPLAVVVAVTGLALAAAASRAGDEALGFSLCAVTGLLVSPISWTHHWVIAIPALLLAGVTVWRTSQGRLRLGTAVAAAGIAGIAVVGWVRLARRVPSSGWRDMPAGALAASAVYVLLGLCVLAVAGWYRAGQARQRARRMSTRTGGRAERSGVPSAM